MRYVKTFTGLLIHVFFFANTFALSGDYKLREIKNPEVLYSKQYIINQIKQTLDWQLNNMPEESWRASVNRFEKIDGNGWIRSTFYAGVMAAYKTTNEQKYLDELYNWGKNNKWKTGQRARHADDFCCVQTYVDLYLMNKDTNEINPSITAFDIIVDDPMPASVIGWDNNKNWSWCDALFMAPPSMAKLYVATKEQKYLETMDLLFRETYNHLYDKNEKLFYRDSRFKPDADSLILSANGKPVFWSRGDGWVIAGLARILESMPNDFESKKWYEDLFTDMSAKLITLQDKNGFWHSNLLDADETPEPEASGTAFFCYGLAWGVNNGYLDKDVYLPAIKKAWEALNKCLDEQGQLHWIQLVGSAPAPVKYEDTVEYATGAFLLAASEMIKLVN